MIKICNTCGIEFRIKAYQKETRKYCCFKCYYPQRFGRTPANKGKTYQIPQARTGKIINCANCGKQKYFQSNQLNKRPCKYCSIACARFSLRKVKLKYSSLHARIKLDWGKADLCENTLVNKHSNIFDWANISGKYLLDRKDWMKLCRKCHIKYDKGKNDLAYKNYMNLTR